MSPGQGAEAKQREDMLKRIAKLAKHQGSFRLACKKYTQVSCIWLNSNTVPLGLLAAMLVSLHSNTLSCPLSDRTATSMLFNAQDLTCHVP